MDQDEEIRRISAGDIDLFEEKTKEFVIWCKALKPVQTPEELVAVFARILKKVS